MLGSHCLHLAVKERAWQLQHQNITSSAVLASMIGTADSSPAFWYPYRRFQVCSPSSKVSLLRFFLTMPFCAANVSHLVGGRGTGSGLARGSGVLGAGSCASRPTCRGRFAVLNSYQLNIDAS